MDNGESLYSEQRHGHRRASDIQIERLAARVKLMIWAASVSATVLSGTLIWLGAQWTGPGERMASIETRLVRLENAIPPMLKADSSLLYIKCKENRNNPEIVKTEYLVGAGVNCRRIVNSMGDEW